MTLLTVIVVLRYKLYPIVQKGKGSILKRIWAKLSFSLNPHAKCKWEEEKGGNVGAK